MPRHMDVTPGDLATALAALSNDMLLSRRGSTLRSCIEHGKRTRLREGRSMPRTKITLPDGSIMRVESREAAAPGAVRRSPLL